MGASRLSAPFDAGFFDRPLAREATDSVKWDGRLARFGRADVLPLWVADMDFPAPLEVTDALGRRAAHPVYGYSRYPDSLVDALRAWLHTRHGWAVEPEWVLWLPGVVASLHAAVLAFSEPGDAVIVQPPVYGPFFSAVTATGRRLLENPLRLGEDGYTMDFEALEGLAAAGARLLLLCSPHNPVGRVWRPEELRRLSEIARRHGLVIVSDEVHHDLVFREHRHHPLALLTGNGPEVVTAVAPSKTFNIPGLHLSALVVPHPAHRAALRRSLALLPASAANPFSLAAGEAAYRHGAAWLAGVLDYLRGSRELALDHIARRLPGIRAVAPEGTYLLWLDCRDLGMDGPALERFFVQQAGVGLSAGGEFGSAGAGFMRLNFAAPRARISEALERIEAALRRL